MSWLTDVAPVVAASGTVAAAMAAWRSANTSARTARRADATSARAVEALGRSTMPRPGVYLNMDGAKSDPDSAALLLIVVNYGANPGLVLGFTVSRSDGFQLSRQFAPPLALGAPIAAATVNRQVIESIGRMPRTVSDPGQETSEVRSTSQITLEVEFTDMSSLVRWRARSRMVETVQRRETDDEAQWDFDGDGEAEVEIVTDLTSVDDRPVGLIRRSWRKIY